MKNAGKGKHQKAWRKGYLGCKIVGGKHVAKPAWTQVSSFEDKEDGNGA